MKMLFVVHYPVFAGPHNQALRLSEPLRAKGWNTTVLLPAEPGNAAIRLSDSGIEVIEMPLHRLRAKLDPRFSLAYAASLPAEVTRIRNLIRDRAIDLVILAGLTNPHAALAASLENVPLVWQLLDSLTPRILRMLMMPLVVRLSDAVMFAGEDLKRLHPEVQRRGVPTFVYYPPIATRIFCPSATRRVETRRRIGIPDDAPLVGTVANFVPVKGIEYLIQAAPAIYRSQPNTWFLIVGQSLATHPDYTAYLQDAIRNSGVPIERFILTGGRSDVENYYAAMDVNVVPSLSEAAPTTVLEAMACGVPVVATDVGSVRELIEDGVGGLVIPPADVEALSAAVVRILDAPRLRAAMARYQRRRAVERYDAESCALQHLTALDAAVAHHASRRRNRQPSSGRKTGAAQPNVGSNRKS